MRNCAASMGEVTGCLDTGGDNTKESCSAWAAGTAKVRGLRDVITTRPED